MAKKIMSPRATFREELEKLLPGLKWVIRKADTRIWDGDNYRKSTPDEADSDHMCAVGVESSGFNRLFTLVVHRYGRRGPSDTPLYKAKASHGRVSAPWAVEAADGTLARVIRCMQETDERRQNEHGHVARYIQAARAPKPPRQRLSDDRWLKAVAKRTAALRTAGDPNAPPDVREAAFAELAKELHVPWPLQDETGRDDGAEG